MAGGWLNLLSLGARIARPFIQLGVTLGRSLASIGNALTRAGAAVEATTLRRIVDAERAERAAAVDIVGRGVDRVPDVSEFTEAVTRQRREFAWRVRTAYVDPSTGASVTRYLTISTDKLLTPSDAVDLAEEMLADEYAISDRFIVSSEVVSATRAGLTQRL